MILSEAPSQLLLGTELVGDKTGQRWRVVSKPERPPESTGGTFSVGYLAEDERGRRGFLKATDVALMRPDPKKRVFDQLVDAITIQKFERVLLDLCADNKLDRIVHAIDYGEHYITVNGSEQIVFFIIFEVAQGDVRSLSRNIKENKLSWIPQVLHNATVATAQLHGVKVSHNDIKPSNLLIFGASLQKLGDLGRATGETVVGPWDGLLIAGDTTYAPPEAWGYHFVPPSTRGRVVHDFRLNVDLYMLGSVAYFLLCGQSLNQVIRYYLRPEYDFRNWGGTFEDVLPYLRDAHGCAIQEAEKSLSEQFGHDAVTDLSEIISMIRYLTEVDPVHRGDPRNAAAGLPRPNLQRQISRCDLLAKRLRISGK